MMGWTARYDGLLDRAESGLSTVTAAAARGEAALRQQFEAPVSRWMGLREQNRLRLQALGGELVAAPAGLREAGWPAFQAASEVYTDLAAPFDAEVRPAVGNPLMGLVVVGVVVSLVAIAWCWVSLSEQERLSEQIDLQRAELEARVQALRWGQALPPSTVQPMLRRDDDDHGSPGFLPLLVGAVGLGGILWWKSKGRHR
jgi:hypothetical protein